MQSYTSTSSRLSSSKDWPRAIKKSRCVDKVEPLPRTVITKADRKSVCKIQIKT